MTITLLVHRRVGMVKDAAGRACVRLLGGQSDGVFTPTAKRVSGTVPSLAPEVGLDHPCRDVAKSMDLGEKPWRRRPGRTFLRGGIVARHVADRMPDRISFVIYLERFVPRNG